MTTNPFTARLRQELPAGRFSWKEVSPLGLGTVKFGRNQKVKYPGGEGFTLPTDSEIESLLDLAIDCGITLLDTAPAYGAAEERLGQLLGARRDKFFIVTKTGEEFNNGESEYIFTAAHTRKSVERSLQRLNTHFIDCVLLHCNRDDLKAVCETDALETLSRLKDEGKIGAFGASTNSVEGGKMAVVLSDCVMVSYNKNYTAERDVIAYANELGKPVLVKKGLASGHVGDLGDLGENIRYVVGTPGVTSLVFGSLNPSNILANIRAMADI